MWGEALSLLEQADRLHRGPEIIIATPGRLIDYVKQHKVVSLHACEICVLDEADRMFDLGFIKDIRFLLRRMPERTTRQTLLFSATLSHRVLELAYEHMNEPEKVIVEAEFITAARVRQVVYFPSNEEKLPLLIGGATTSRTHTAVKIEPNYPGPTVWVPDASRAVGVASALSSPEQRDAYMAQVRAAALAVHAHVRQKAHLYALQPLPFAALAAPARRVERVHQCVGDVLLVHGQAGAKGSGGFSFTSRQTGPSTRCLCPTPHSPPTCPGC